MSAGLVLWLFAVLMYAISAGALPLAEYLGGCAALLLALVAGCLEW